MTLSYPTSGELVKRLSEALIESTTWYDGKVHLTPDQQELVMYADAYKEKE